MESAVVERSSQISFLNMTKDESPNDEGHPNDEG